MKGSEMEKAPTILDFSGDGLEALNKLESILYTSGWNHYIIMDPDTPSEEKLLFSLIREGAIVVWEVYYTFTYTVTDEIKEKAHKYFGRLRKRNMDSIFLNAVDYFSRHESDIEKAENGSLFYPSINAYVRCGDLSPKKLLKLMQKDGCERIIIFGSCLRQDKEQPWEVFHSFEMRAPKTYIIEKLEQMQEEIMQAIHRAMEKSGSNDIIPDVSFFTDEE